MYLAAASTAVDASPTDGGYLFPSRLRSCTTDWRAVGYGFVVMVIAGLLASFAPVIGHIGAGLIGGFVAGYVAGGGLVGLVGGPIGSLLGGAGVSVIGLFPTLLFAIDSALAGAIGGELAD